MSQKLIIFVTSKQVKIVTNMEEEDKDVERILEIIKSEQLNASAFAEKIGVQKSSVSHVISGRNKPSKEFMVKILRTFPEISSDWLFLGLGDMYRVPKQPAQEQPATDLLSAQMSAPQPSAQPQPSAHQLQTSPGQTLQTTLLFSDTNAEPVSAEPAKPQPVAVETPKPQQPKTQKVAQAESPIKAQSSDNKEIKQNATKPEPVDQPAPSQPKVQTQQPEPVNIMKTDPEKIIVFYSNKTFTLYSPSGE